MGRRPSPVVLTDRCRAAGSWWRNRRTAAPAHRARSAPHLAMGYAPSSTWMSRAPIARNRSQNACRVDGATVAVLAPMRAATPAPTVYEAGAALNPAGTPVVSRFQLGRLALSCANPRYSEEVKSITTPAASGPHLPAAVALHLLGDPL